MSKGGGKVLLQSAGECCYDIYLVILHTKTSNNNNNNNKNNSNNNKNDNSNNNSNEHYPQLT